jgi:diguanylate cyclase
VNDTFGHATGDEVLRRVAGLLAGCCRDDDVVVRYGGDEFVVLLAPAQAGTDPLTGARRLGERRLRRVRAQDWSVLVGSLPVTVSAGVASGEEAGTALRHSDAAMLAAKRAGRDTLVQL